MAFLRTKTIKGRAYRYLVENHRDPQTGKVRQKVVQYLGPCGKASGATPKPLANS
jgi:hypothetical protein